MLMWGAARWGMVDCEPDANRDNQYDDKYDMCHLISSIRCSKKKAVYLPIEMFQLSLVLLLSACVYIFFGAPHVLRDLRNI